MMNFITKVPHDDLNCKKLELHRRHPARFAIRVLPLGDDLVVDPNVMQPSRSWPTFAFIALALSVDPMRPVVSKIDDDLLENPPNRIDPTLD